MLNKNDPLIGAVQEVMRKNQAERDATNLVNEKFGVTDRKALPHERQYEWDAAYKSVLTEGAEGSIPKTASERNLAAKYGDKRVITKGDILRGRGVVEEEGAPKTDPYAENEGAGAVTTVKKPVAKPTSITPTQQDALKKKIQSIKEGARVERMVGHIKSSEIKAGMSPKKAERIAWATANKRGELSEITAYPGTAASSTSNSMMTAQSRMRAGEAAQARLSAARERATSATDTAPQPQSGSSSLARQQSGDTAPRPQSSVALQRQQSNDTAPRPQSSVGLQRQQSGDNAPRPQSSVGLQRQQSGDTAPRPQSSVALQRQQSGDTAPRPQSSVALQRQQSGDTAPRPQPGSDTLQKRQSGQQARMGGNPTGAPSSQAAPKKVTPTGNPNMAGSGAGANAPKPTLRPVKKPGAAAPAAGARRQQPVAGSQRRAQAPARASTPAQRAQANRRIDRGNAAPGTKYQGLGVTTGKTTGTTVTQKAAPAAKRPVGTGRVK